MIGFKDFLLEGKDEAKYIRTKLKQELGLSNKDVSVKTRQGGMSSAVNVSIKTMKALALKQKIEAIGEEKESYQTDAASGEILGGGNTFIFTEIDYKFQDELRDVIQKEFDKVTKGNYDPDGKDVILFKTFVIGNSRDMPFVMVKGTQAHTEIRDINYVGSAVLTVIRMSKDDSLYSKIK